MASLGHVAVGLLGGRLLFPQAGRKTTAAMVILSGLSVLPDLDYLGVMMGVPDAGPCGHRGATHSLVPPVVAGLLAAALAPRLDLPRWRAALVCALVVGSHALLDAMTVGSRGVPLFWPLNFTRFELPWRPIPNAPCGLEYLSWRGMHVAAIEALQFFPMLAFSLWPRRSGARRKNAADIGSTPVASTTATPMTRPAA